MDDPDITQAKAREFMQKAYVCYATVSSTAKSGKNEVTRARWPDMVTKVAQQHGQYINEMEKGKFYDKIELDPRENMQADEKVDLKSLPQYKGQLSKQQTSIRDDKVTVRPVKRGADKYVDKMLELARAAKERVRARKEGQQPDASADQKQQSTSKDIADVAKELVEEKKDET